MGILLVLGFPYARYGALQLTYKIESRLYGDEGEAEGLAMMGRLGGILERKYLLKGMARELEQRANDQVIEGYVRGLVYMGSKEDAMVFGAYAHEALDDPKKEYIVLIMIYGIQELGQVRFAEYVAPSMIIGDGYDRFGVGMPRERVTSEEKERFARLTASFEAWWKSQTSKGAFTETTGGT